MKQILDNMKDTHISSVPQDIHMEEVYTHNGIEFNSDKGNKLKVSTIIKIKR
jgi:hypothetical protein